MFVQPKQKHMDVKLCISKNVHLNEIQCIDRNFTLNLGTFAFPVHSALWLTQNSDLVNLLDTL